jgi:plasmid stabilization system protein ParE
LQGIRRYIGNFNPYAAQDMANRIIEAGNRLAALPYRGHRFPARSCAKPQLSDRTLSATASIGTAC